MRGGGWRGVGRRNGRDSRGSEGMWRGRRKGRESSGSEGMWRGRREGRWIEGELEAGGRTETAGGKESKGQGVGGRGVRG